MPTQNSLNFGMCLSALLNKDVLKHMIQVFNPCLTTFMLWDQYDAQAFTFYTENNTFVEPWKSRSQGGQ